MFCKATLGREMEGFERRARTLRDALNGENAGGAEADAAAVDTAAGSVADYVWFPTHSVFVRLAVFELTRAMNESPDRAIRMIIQNHQAYVLEALAERVLAPYEGGDFDADDDGGPDGDGGEAMPQPSAEPLQQAA